jgi:hypothetical protein
MTFQEKARAHQELVKTKYHATTAFNSNPYRVEEKSPIMTNGWITHRWYFPTEQDAIEYCNNEIKDKFTARVIKEEYVAEENTVYPTLIYTREAKS